MSIDAYAPESIQPKLDELTRGLKVFARQAQNLIFMILPLENKRPYRNGGTDVPAACWKSVCCDVHSGAFVSPYQLHRRRRLADLLAQPPEVFLERARHSQAVSQLPITQIRPDWVDVATQRLKRCRPHPEQLLLQIDDGVCGDFQAAQAVIARVRAGLKPTQ